MSQNTKTLFIADLHLEADNQRITNQFIELLNSCDDSVDAIYVLGDLFELWIGDDDSSPFHEEIIRNFKIATQNGLKIYFMHGNRDFLIGPKFMAETGCELLSEEEKIQIYGKSILLMHGDTLCTHDAAYQRARRFAQNKILQKLFLLLPLSIRKQIAARARKASEKYTKNTDANIMDVAQEEVERVMQKHQVDYLIHGHTHRPNTHHFTQDEKNKERIVLPAWHGGGSILEWRSDGEKQFINLKN